MKTPWEEEFARRLPCNFPFLQTFFSVLLYFRDDNTINTEYCDIIQPIESNIRTRGPPFTQEGRRKSQRTSAADRRIFARLCCRTPRVAVSPRRFQVVCSPSGCRRRRRRHGSRLLLIGDRLVRVRWSSVFHSLS